MSDLAGRARALMSCFPVFDAHVDSLRMHPTWHPEVDDPEARRVQSKKEFAD